MAEDSDGRIALAPIKLNETKCFIHNTYFSKNLRLRGLTEKSIENLKRARYVYFCIDRALSNVFRW